MISVLVAHSFAQHVLSTCFSVTAAASDSMLLTNTCAHLYTCIAYFIVASAASGVHIARTLTGYVTGQKSTVSI